MKLARILVQKAIPLVLTTVFLGTTSLAQTGSSAAPLRLTVAPAVASPIQIKTLPNAACTLHPEGSQDAAHSLKLYADGEGMVHFHARPDLVSDVQVRTNMLVGTGNAVIVVECSASGEVATHRVELRAASAPTSEMPAPTVPVKAGGTIRRALSNEELSSLSDEELVMAHYPPRPDPKSAPGAYAAWLTAVSRPTTLVAPQTVQRPDIVHGPLATDPICWTLVPCTISNQLSPNWSGYTMLPYTTNTGQAQVPFKAVTGMWQVPRVTGEHTLGGRTNSALWIGLDGVTGLSNLSNNEVVQDGTEQDVVDQLMWSPEMGQWVHWDFATYYAWTEWFPEPQQMITNFMVNPGDLILAEVWVGPSPNCTLYRSPLPYIGFATSPAIVVYCPLIGHFFIENLLNGQSISLFAPVPQGRRFSGTSAEWIMERPSVSPAGSCCAEYFGLSNYDTAAMYNASALRDNGQWIPYDVDLNEQFTMTNGGSTVLSTVTTEVYDGQPSIMRFTWHNFE